MTSESQMLIEVCRAMSDQIVENSKRGYNEHAVFYYPDSEGKRNIIITDKGWCDFRTGDGGHSPVGLVMDVRNMSKDEARRFLDSIGMGYSRYTGDIFRCFKSRSNKYRAKGDRQRATPKREPGGKFQTAQNLWDKSKPIPPHLDAPKHPFWLWSTTGDKPGIMHGCNEVPPFIRFLDDRRNFPNLPPGRYWQPGDRCIVALRTTFEAWQRGVCEVFSVAVVAIDVCGNKRRVWHDGKAGDKHTYGSGADGVFIGDSQSPKVALCEGVADALAVLNVFYEGQEVAVCVPNRTIDKVLNIASAVEWLASREVVLFADADGAGERAVNAVVKALHKRGREPLVFRQYPNNAKDPAEAAPHVKVRCATDGQEGGGVPEKSVPMPMWEPQGALWGGSVLEQNFKRQVMGVNPLTQF